MAKSPEDLKTQNRELSAELKLRDRKEKAKEQELEQKEKEIETLKAEKEKLGKRMKGRVMDNREAKLEQLSVDSLSSMGGQAVNLAVQSLIDYLIETFPDSIGKHRVAAKGLPLVMTAAWYLGEVLTMKQEAKLGKKVRIQAANLLTNLGFVYLGQAYRQDQDTKKVGADKVAQENAALNAKISRMQEELQKATKKAKDIGA